MQRVLRFVRHLTSFGWQPVVVTVQQWDAPGTDPSLVAQVPRECRVYRTPILEPYALYRKLTGRSREEKLPAYLLIQSDVRGWRDRLARWIRRNLFLPDARVGWLFSARKSLWQVWRREKPQVLFSTCPPYSTHLLALDLVRRTGIPWVADFRDPWTEAFWVNDRTRLPLARSIDAHLERAVLRRVSAVTTVSEGMVRLLARKTANRSQVIYSGVEPRMASARPSEKFIVAYFGHLRAEHNPEPLLKALAGLPAEVRKQCQLLIAGHAATAHHPLFAAYRQKLSIQILPFMPHEQVLEYGQQASVLFLPRAVSTYAAGTVNAKMFDYLALRKPILALREPGSEVHRVLEATGSGQLFAPHQLSEMRQFLLAWFSRWKEDGFVLLDNEHLLKPFLVHEQVRNLAQLFQELSTGVRHRSVQPKGASAG